MTSPPPKDPFFRIINAAFYGIGAVFLFVGFGFAINELSFGRTALRSSGIVVDLRISDSGDGPNYYPIVEFKTNDGETVRFEGISTSPAPSKGSLVPVVYNRTTPKNARIDSFIQRWFLPAAFQMVGTTMLAFAYFKWFKSNGSHS